MKRITLTAAAARLIEQQVSAYEDQRDEKGKPLREPKERRQWDRIADLFSDAAGKYDTVVGDLQKQGREFGSLLIAEQAREVDDHLADWRKEGVGVDTVNAATTALKELFAMRIQAKERELTDAIIAAEDTLGQASCQVDIDDAQLDFLRTAWDALDLDTTRRMRRLVNQITDALHDADDLVKEGDRYVPKRIKLVALETEAGG